MFGFGLGSGSGVWFSFFFRAPPFPAFVCFWLGGEAGVIYSPLAESCSYHPMAPSRSRSHAAHAPASSLGVGGLGSSGGAGGGDLNTLRIVVATDNHLGFLERDIIRHADPFEAFEEVLAYAQENAADCVLLGGDLFHENRPSRSTLVKTIELFTKYCMGERASHLQVLSDQAINFPSTGSANFEDPNYNVSMPVFIIHGNHDDPAGTENISALDVLASARVLNYFGKTEIAAGAHAGKIPVHPVLLGKGKTRVALYGLGNVRDERLSRVFLQQNITWVRPEQTPESPEISDWLNIMTIHQNRVFHGSGHTSAIDENWLPRWLDLVVWGHEHECKLGDQPSSSSAAHHAPRSKTGGRSKPRARKDDVDDEAMQETDFEVFQPGSSCAIQLSEGEARKKHFMSLDIQGTSYKATYIPFSKVRPFAFETVALRDHADEIDAEDPRSLETFLTRKIEQMIAGVAGTSGELPLIRLRVDSTGYTTVNTARFGQKFVGKIANPGDVLLFHRRAQRRAAGASGGDASGAAAADEAQQGGAASEQDVLNQARVNRLITKNLRTDMELLAVDELGDALQEYVAHGEIHAISSFVQKKLQLLQKKMGASNASFSTEKEVAAAAAAAAKELHAGAGAGAAAAAAAEAPKAPAPAKKAPAKKAPARKPPARKRKADDSDDDDDFGDDDDDSDDDGVVPEPRSRTRRAAAAKVVVDLMEEEDDDDNNDGGAGGGDDDIDDDDDDDDFGVVRSTRLTQRRGRR